MQNPAGHRINLHSGEFKEIGIGVVNGVENPDFGPQYVTQDLGNPGDVRYVTGVVYEDLNSNNFYDIGEGRSGVRVDVAGSAYYALSTTSGGYSVPVPQDGTYAVTFTGGGYSTFTTTATIFGGENEKVDYLAAVFGLAGDYNGNDVVDAADYTVWRNHLGQSFALTNENPLASTPGVVDQEDYNFWKTHFGEILGSGSAAGATVPEPQSWTLVLLGSTLLSSRVGPIRNFSVRQL
jgi:hypothetical protein